MKIGLVGFGGSGKTTVFSTMTGLDAPVGYDGEVRLGTVRVPDERITAMPATNAIRILLLHSVPYLKWIDLNLALGPEAAPEIGRICMFSTGYRYG